MLDCKTARLDIRLYEEDKIALKQYCSDHNLKITDFITELIKERISKEKHDVQQRTDSTNLQNDQGVVPK